MRRENPGILQFFSDLPAQSEPSGEVFFGHFLPEFLLGIQETAKAGAAALQLGLQFVEYLLDLGQLTGVVGRVDLYVLEFSDVFQHCVCPLCSNRQYHTPAV